MASGNMNVEGEGGEEGREGGREKRQTPQMRQTTNCHEGRSSGARRSVARGTVTLSMRPCASNKHGLPSFVLQ